MKTLPNVYIRLARYIHYLHINGANNNDDNDDELMCQNTNLYLQLEFFVFVGFWKVLIVDWF